MMLGVRKKVNFLIFKKLGGVIRYGVEKKSKNE